MKYVKFTVVALCLIVLIPPTLLAKQLYKWVDKDGVVHVTDNPEVIPEGYRSSAVKFKPKSRSGETIENIKVSFENTFEGISIYTKENIKKIVAGTLAIIGIIALVYTLRGYLKFKKRREKEKQLKALELSNIDNFNRTEFEDYIIRLLTHRGFKVETTGNSVYLGVDFIAQKNDLKYAVQIKQQTSPVPRLLVSDIDREKHRYDCNRVMLVTNSYFSEDAIELAKSTGCELVDRDALAKWVLDFQNSKARSN
jgi:restriction system protein